MLLKEVGAVNRLPQKGEKMMQITNIQFINEDGKEDETQFDTHDEKELARLWWEFCKENKLIDIDKKEISMDTNFHMVRTFKYNPKHFGICSWDEIKQINNHFKLSERSNVELQNLRDFVVLYYSEKAQKLREENNDDYIKLHDTMSAITGVIDNHKWNRGMEV